MAKWADWFDARIAWRERWARLASNYYVANNLTVWYVFGFLALLVLVNQLLSGIWLSFFYTPTVSEAFNSLQIIMRDVPFGWLWRLMHSSGASALFVVLYLHLFRGLWYGSYQHPRELVWLIGLSLFYLIALEACLGYLLPWGQLSYWGAQVLTAFAGVIPYVGETLVLWIRGDYVVSGVTLQRFFALHVIVMPMLLVAVVWLHIVALRHVGGSNPRGVELTAADKIPFYPYYTVKDAAAGLLFLTIFFSVVFFFPTGYGYLLHPLNAIPANPLLTPEEITPLWYLAPFYAMLRATPHKGLGVVVMLAALLMLSCLPWLDKSPVRVMRAKGRYSQGALCLCVVSFIALGYLGTEALTPARLWSARVFTVLYFAWGALMPWYTRYEMRT